MLFFSPVQTSSLWTVIFEHFYVDAAAADQQDKRVPWYFTFLSHTHDLLWIRRMQAEYDFRIVGPEPMLLLLLFRLQSHLPALSLPPAPSAARFPLNARGCCWA